MQANFPNSVQANFSNFVRVISALIGLAGLGAPLVPVQGGELRKNIVVLVDSSKSVDSKNRDSALKLVAGLITGEVAPDWKEEGWGFKEPQPSRYPLATANLRRLVEGAAEKSALAADVANFVICPLGNYERIKDLRDKLATPGSSPPTEIAAQLKQPAVPFDTFDCSTHIRLAEALVARAFLKSSTSQKPYYLIVISDFNEDCHNSPLAVYDGGRLQDALNVKNSGVFSGKLPFNDGDRTPKPPQVPKYSTDDVSAIESLQNDIRGDLLIGEFVYDQKKVAGLGKLPVSVKIYSPMVKRDLKFDDKSKLLRWVLPDPAPDFLIIPDGLKMDDPLQVKLTRLADKQEKLISETCSLVLATKRLELGKLLGGDEFKSFVAAGRYQLTLSALQEGGLPAEDTAELEILSPQISITMGDIGLAGSTQIQPAAFPPYKEYLSEKVTFKLDQKLIEKHSFSVQCGAKKTEWKIAGDSIEVPLRDLLDVQPGDEPIRLLASLPLPPTEQTAISEGWLLLPELKIWAEDKEGSKAEGRFALGLSRGITLKTSHQGVRDMDWRGTTVTGPDGKRVAMNDDDPNSLDFSGLDPGEYTVIAEFGFSKSPAKFGPLTVIVPPKSRWLLIALIALVGVSLTLLSWHFLRGRFQGRRG